LATENTEGKSKIKNQNAKRQSKIQKWVEILRQAQDKFFYFDGVAWILDA